MLLLKCAWLIVAMLFYRHRDLFFSAVKIIGLVICYYPSSIGLTFLQKRLLKEFKFPLFVVLSHFSIKFLLAAVLRSLYTLFTGKCRITLSWRDFFFRLAPTGAAGSLDIGLSNWSLEFITISLYTMAKSTSIIFVFMFGVLFCLEKFRPSVALISLVIAVGLFLFTYKSTEVDVGGIILVEIAAACAGIRWTLSQHITQRKEAGLHNPIDMIYHIQPWMALTTLPMFFAFEGISISLSASLFDSTDVHATLSCLFLILAGGLLAFFMEVTEYMLLVATSSLTLNALGILKEIATLTLAHFYSGDEIKTTINFVGLFVCIFGLIMYAAIKQHGHDTVQRKNSTGSCE